MTVCPDCLVSPGEPHEPGCDVARCLVTGHQALSCPYTHYHGADIWTGIWPGARECWEFGWFSKFRPGIGWTSCRRDDPEATPDLNRLSGSGEAEWNQDADRWVLCADNEYSVNLESE